MTWAMVGVGGAMAAKGALDANAARKNQKRHDAFRKAAITYSPWTNMGDPGAGNFGNTDMLSGAIGGGVQGAALGGMLGQSGIFKSAGGAVEGASQAQGAANALGGQDMANQLGSEFGNSMSGMEAKIGGPSMMSQMPQASSQMASAGALGGKKGIYQNILGGGDAAGSLAQQFGSMEGMMGQNPNSIYSAFLAQNR